MARALHRFAQHPAAAYEAALQNLARLPVDEQRSLERMFQQATRLIASTLGVERVGIWLFDETRAQLRCACQYARAGDAYRSGDVLARRDYPTYFAALDDYRAIVADDARTHPATSELTASYLGPERDHVDARRVARRVTTWWSASSATSTSVRCARGPRPRRASSRRSRISSRSRWSRLPTSRHVAPSKSRAQRVSEERRMVALGRVAAAVGHDFGHLLTIVLSHAQEILAEPDLPASAASHATAVVDVDSSQPRAHASARRARTERQRRRADRVARPRRERRRRRRLPARDAAARPADRGHARGRPMRRSASMRRSSIKC